MTNCLLVAKKVKVSKKELISRELLHYPKTLLLFGFDPTVKILAPQNFVVNRKFATKS